VHKRVLAVGNEARLLDRIAAEFQARGYRVATATNSSQAMRRLFHDHPHLMIIDAGTEDPDWDGWKLCRRVRAVADVPLVMLVSPNRATARVEALRLGADDCLDQPVSLEELILRCAAILRRARPWELERDRWTFVDGTLWVSPHSHHVWVEEQAVELTPREYQLLTCLVENAGRTLSHEELIKRVWNGTARPCAVRQYIQQLRQKIEPDPARPRYILTERGVGYQFAGVAGG
jgi:two-component system KDP operon response regulator KdpE